MYIISTHIHISFLYFTTLSRFFLNKRQKEEDIICEEKASSGKKLVFLKIPLFIPKKLIFWFKIKITIESYCHFVTVAYNLFFHILFRRLEMKVINLIVINPGFQTMRLRNEISYVI